MIYAIGEKMSTIDSYLSGWEAVWSGTIDSL